VDAHLHVVRVIERLVNLDLEATAASNRSRAKALWWIERHPVTHELG
jgi:hypothetical protein